MYTKVIVIGATNLPWALDSAFLRRFDRHIHVGLPSPAERLALDIFQISSIGEIARLLEVKIPDRMPNNTGIVKGLCGTRKFKINIVLTTLLISARKKIKVLSPVDKAADSFVVTSNAGITLLRDKLLKTTSSGLFPY